MHFAGAEIQYFLPKIQETRMLLVETQYFQETKMQEHRRGGKTTQRKIAKRFDIYYFRSRQHLITENIFKCRFRNKKQNAAKKISENTEI